MTYGELVKALKAHEDYKTIAYASGPCGPFTYRDTRIEWFLDRCEEYAEDEVDGLIYFYSLAKVMVLTSEELHPGLHSGPKHIHKRSSSTMGRPGFDMNHWFYCISCGEWLEAL
jgi:hypothetical protein